MARPKTKLILATLLCFVAAADSSKTFSVSIAQHAALSGRVNRTSAAPWPMLEKGSSLWTRIHTKDLNPSLYGNAQASSSQRREGLHSIQLVSLHGKVIVNLPDDMTAGDTISGTVSTSPEGKDERERARNLEQLNAHFVELAGLLVPVGSKRFKLTVPAMENEGKTSLLLLDENQREIDRKELAVGSRRAAPRDSFDFPSVIEQGRPFEIRGPFDGDLANTRTTVGYAEVELLAESPGKLVARNTTKATGPATVQVNEQGIVTESSVRTLAVSLSAPKLNLLRGEQTTLSLRVRGLAGIKQPTPLLLENESSDVVSLSGGDRQTFEINPRGQEANDSFSTQRVLTGIKPGGFTITVRVDVRFLDLWLKELADEEGWFDNATGSFRRGRQLADEASDARNRSEEGATQTAEEALRELDRARTYVRRALEAGEISEGTAKSLEEYIAQYESQARRVKDQPPREVIVVSAPTPTPPSRPSPTPTATVTEGRFAPSQGVWQDDDVFADKPGKQLTRIGPASWDAELKMVVGRRTLLFGIRDDRRVRILIRGTTNGTRLVRVKFRFTLFEGDKGRVIYEERRAENQVRLDGPVGPREPFEASLLSSTGIPEYGSFKIDRAGPYRIEGELVRENGAATGLKVTVRGEAIETQAPSFRIVPVILSDPISQSVELEKEAKRVAGHLDLMDYYLPLRHDTIKSSADPAYDLRSLEPDFLSYLKSKLPLTADIQKVRRDSIKAAIGQRFGTASSLTGGDKIAVLLSEKDFGLTIDPGEAFAYAVSQKVFMIQPYTQHFIVAHEFIHTTPFSWAETQMEKECGRNYHGYADANYGNGVKIQEYAGYRMDRVHAIMGPAYTFDLWITQCSYWHLLNYLVKSPDPDLLLVRGYLAGFYELNIHVLMQLHKQNPAAGFAASAFEASERARARSLLDLLAEARADIRQGVEPALLERERLLHQLIAARAERQSQLLNSKSAPDQLSAVARELETTLAEYQDVQAKIRNNSPRYAALMHPQPLTVKQIQTEVLDAETVLLEYLLGARQSYLWAVTHNSVAVYELPGSAEIEKVSRRFYELLKTNTNNEALKQTANRLAEMLLAPAAEQLVKKRLAIVADGALHYVPFAALPEPVQRSEVRDSQSTVRITTSNYTPLIVEHEVVSLPSASTLAVLKKEMKGRKLAPKLVAVVADPVFDPNDVRVRRGPGHAINSAAEPAAQVGDSGLLRSVEETGLARGAWPLPRLLGTRREARVILSLSPVQRSRQALDFEASRETATAGDLGTYQVIHFATHALINNQHPELSGLVLSLVDEKGRLQDGFLRLNDIYNLQLPAELVVLSACQTGLGQEIRGEGLIGLTRGFMYAGAPRVITSLWQVDDKATSELMGRFYRGLLGDKKLSAAAALREAQIVMWRQKDWQSPYYWAAFSLQGEWK